MVRASVTKRSALVWTKSVAGLVVGTVCRGLGWWPALGGVDPVCVGMGAWVIHQTSPIPKV